MSLQMEIKWASKIQPRRGIQLSSFTQDRKILVHHVDGNGISLIDALSGQEEWSSRIKNGCLSNHFSENEDSYLISGTFHWYRFNKVTGSSDQIVGVRPSESFIAQRKNFALFENVDAKKYYSCVGHTLFDENSGKVIRVKKDEALRPIIGNRSNFFGSIETAGVTTYYAGSLSDLASYTSQKDWNVVAIPELEDYMRIHKTDNGESGFSVYSSKKPDFVYFYNWIGELRFSVPLPAELATDVDLTGTVPWGENGILLVGYNRKTRARIVFVVGDIKNPTISRILETPGMAHVGNCGVCCDWFVWLDVMVRGGPIFAANLHSGKIEILREGDTNPFLLCSDQGVFFGDSTKGVGHIARGSFLPE